MSPQRLVATLLEADDMLPPAPSPAPGEQPSPASAPGEEPAIDVKSFTGRASEEPGIILGIPVAGTYRELERKFHQQRLRRDGPEEYFAVDRNTTLVRDTFNNNISVRFHNTDILTVTPDDTLTLDNGGWVTVTTLSRLNDWLPGGWGLYAKDHSWWWHNHRHNDEDANPGFKRLQPYSNGDSITADGRLHALSGPEYKKVRMKRAVTA